MAPGTDIPMTAPPSPRGRQHGGAISARAKQNAAEILTPMVDVSFLLIIFFLVQQQAMSETNLVRLPTVAPDERAALAADPAPGQRAAFAMAADGSISVDDDLLDGPALVRALAACRERGEEVTLNAHPDAPFQAFVRWSAAYAKVGFQRDFHVATQTVEQRDEPTAEEGTLANP